MNRSSLLRFLQTEFLGFDILHFHSNARFFRSRYIDALLLKLKKKKVIRHFHGSDIRNKKIPLLRYLVDYIFVSTPDLLKYAPNATWLPNPFDLDRWIHHLQRNKQNKNNINILHPTIGKVKGTDIIIKNVKRLKKEGDGYVLKR